MRSEIYLGLSFFSYLLATLFYVGLQLFKHNLIGIFATSITTLGFLSHTIGLILRTKEASHPPFTNMYESVVFFSWAIILIYLFIEHRFKSKIIGIFVLPIVLLAIGYASVLPGEYKEVRPIVPALQSFWLPIHVSTCFLSYACFAIAFCTSLIYLLKERFGFKRIPDTEFLDQITYRVVSFGFLLLTFGIITGAIWANYAWGRYWGWDPKETWSLVTWLIYVGYLHARFISGWRGKKTAWIAIIGFLISMFTFVGVNFLLSGLHSYV
ncbi:MAG: c-type cytochrome biogenesis protein CcsB [bacterium]|nr:c-type cytochrome biogenesis protein CcsB [bacterium]